MSFVVTVLRAVIVKGTTGSGLFKRICVAVNGWRQNVELSVLILAQAVAEVESRFLLVLLVLSLLPVASYSLFSVNRSVWHVDFSDYYLNCNCQHCLHHSSAQPNANIVKEA